MSMMLCTDTVTLIRPIRGQKDDFYECRIVVGASWYTKSVVQLQDKGLVAANRVSIRIPAKLLADFTPQTGDYAVRGAVSGITCMNDLKDRAYVKLLTVGDNRRGRFPHWALTGA